MAAGGIRAERLDAPPHQFQKAIPRRLVLGIAQPIVPKIEHEARHATIAVAQEFRQARGQIDFVQCLVAVLEEDAGSINQFMTLAKLGLGIHLSQDLLGHQRLRRIAPGEIGQVDLKHDRRDNAHAEVLHLLILAIPSQGIVAVLPDPLLAEAPGAHDEQRSIAVMDIVVAVVHAEGTLALHRFLVPNHKPTFHLIDHLAVDFQRAADAVEVEIKTRGRPAGFHERGPALGKRHFLLLLEHGFLSLPRKEGKSHSRRACRWPIIRREDSGPGRLPLAVATVVRPQPVKKCRPHLKIDNIHQGFAQGFVARWKEVAVGRAEESPGRAGINAIVIQDHCPRRPSWSLETVVGFQQRHPASTRLVERRIVVVGRQDAVDLPRFLDPRSGFENVGQLLALSDEAFLLLQGNHLSDQTNGRVAG